MKKVVIGILAHVDSGKTTLSEAMLYLSGATRSIGRVDNGSAFLDNHALERKRGITIFSHRARFTYENTEFTLIDTPGHIDFSTEMERALKILDYAVLIVSASAGVQSHTKTLTELLKVYNIPTFVFINKTDLETADCEKTFLQLQEYMDGCCVMPSEENDEWKESLAMCSEKLMEHYLANGDISNEIIAESVRERSVFLCYKGSALHISGVKELMNGLSKFILNTGYPEEFGARVYKITSGGKDGRLTHMKITGGELRVKELVSKINENGEVQSEKVNQIRIFSGDKYTLSDVARAGDVCAVAGLEKTYAGEGLGYESDYCNVCLEPVLCYGVILPEGVNVSDAMKQMKILEDEDPQLKLAYNEQHKEINIHLMGEVQTEILKDVIKERFCIDVEFSRGSIIYKETVEDAVIGVGHYEPLRHYAEVHLRIEPAKRGSGITFGTQISEDVLDRSYQRLVLAQLKEKIHTGVLTNSPLTDVKITLIAGRAHQKHTEGGDFRQAAYRALRQGLMSAKSILLEPWCEFTATVPETSVGKVMTDIRNMGGEVLQPVSSGDTFVLKGKAPFGGLRNYSAEIVGFTRGKGRISFLQCGYEACANQEEIVNQFEYNPERDTENTADSVFCSHGAGYTVKWNEAARFMHIKEEMREKGDIGEKSEQRQRAREYISSLESDSELMKIFEKTYGPIKKRETSKKAVIRTSPIGNAAARGRLPLKTDNYLLVDGYNIIFAWDFLKKQSEESLDLARSSLINILCNYQGFRGCKVILVFDAYKIKGGIGSVEKVHNISVVYTKEAETADSYIERVSHDLSRKYNVRVATSDTLEQIIILGGGAYRVSADAFLDEVKECETAIREVVAELKSESFKNHIDFSENKE